jgi:predicted RNase H-like HicB family nuclease
LKKYLIIVEETETGYSAFSPDVPRCGSTGKTKEEVERNIQEAIEFHLDGRQEGCKIPEPRFD